MQKFIFVTGGVVSSVGKGIVASSIGRLLKNYGVRSTILKLDPYLNVDPGTMSPYQHGEVFVTADGAETDLDLGHYERFLEEDLSRDNSVSAGQIYLDVLTRERRGEYLSGTVQVVPHITDAIKERIWKVSKDDEVTIVEIGGTVGDIESLPFMEAIRQMRKDAGRDNVMYVHVALVPELKAAGETKTKPAQHSVGELRSVGIQPNILICRTERPLGESAIEKLSTFCDLDVADVIQAIDVDSIYRVPHMLAEGGIVSRLSHHLGLDLRPTIDFEHWEDFVGRLRPKDTVQIAVVGKYVNLPDAYRSIIESLKHAGFSLGVYPTISWVDAEGLDETTEENAGAILKNFDGIVVPGGFGVRGTEGKIKAIRFARMSKTPFLGICLGMQLSVIEFARSFGMDAVSAEFRTPEDVLSDPVIDYLPDQKDLSEVGGTMRLGSYPCVLSRGTRAYNAYRATEIMERHRHRYEVSPAYRWIFDQDPNMVVSGTSPDGTLVEIVERRDHPWFVACQFHPELKSRPTNPHPLFMGLVSAAKKCLVKGV